MVLLGLSQGERRIGDFLRLRAEFFSLDPEAAFRSTRPPRSGQLWLSDEERVPDCAFTAWRLALDQGSPPYAAWGMSGGSVEKMRLRTPARRPRQIGGNGTVTPRPRAHHNMRRLDRVSSQGVRATALVAAAVVFLTLGSPSSGAAAPGLHSLASSAGRSNVLTIDRPSRVAPEDVLVADSRCALRPARSPIPPDGRSSAAT